MFTAHQAQHILHVVGSHSRFIAVGIEGQQVQRVGTSGDVVESLGYRVPRYVEQDAIANDPLAGNNFLLPFQPYRFLPGKRVCLRSEEHTSELQSRENLVCRLLLEKKNIKY